MNKALIVLASAALLASASASVQAQHKHGAAPAKAPAANAASGAELADGEVRRVDRAKGLVLLKHGEIKSINMSPMTMAFKLQDARMAEDLNPGDKIRFAVEQKGDDLIITRLLKVQ